MYSLTHINKKQINELKSLLFDWLLSTFLLHWAYFMRFFFWLRRTQRLLFIVALLPLQLRPAQEKRAYVKRIFQTFPPIDYSFHHRLLLTRHRSIFNWILYSVALPICDFPLYNWDLSLFGHVSPQANIVFAQLSIRHSCDVDLTSSNFLVCDVCELLQFGDFWLQAAIRYRWGPFLILVCCFSFMLFH